MARSIATSKKTKSKPAAKAKAKAKTKTKTKTKPTKKAAGKPAKKTEVVAAPRFVFDPLPVIATVEGLTPLVRRQLVVDTRLGVGRTTTPERVPASYLEIGVHRWRVLDSGVPTYEVVQNTVFFLDSDEPLGLERVQGAWEATGRSTKRGLALDLIHLAWEFNRDWPGRRLPLDDEPARGKRLVVDEGLTDLPWEPDAQFV